MDIIASEVLGAVPMSPEIAHLPWQLSKEEFFRLLNSPRLGQRALYHGMVIVTQQGGRGRPTQIDTQSAWDFYVTWVRSRRVHEVPLLPSEIPGESGSREVADEG